MVEFTYQLQTTHGKVIGSNTVKIEYYPSPLESALQEGVPEGDIHPYIWTESKITPSDPFKPKHGSVQFAFIFRTHLQFPIHYRDDELSSSQPSTLPLL